MILLQVAAAEVPGSLWAVLITAGTGLIGTIGTLFALLTGAWKRIAELEREKAGMKDEVIATLKSASAAASERQAQVEAADRSKQDALSALTRGCDSVVAAVNGISDGQKATRVEIADMRTDIRTTIRDAIMTRRSSTNIPAVGGGGGS